MYPDNDSGVSIGELRYIFGARDTNNFWYASIPYNDGAPPQLLYVGHVTDGEADVVDANSVAVNFAPDQWLWFRVTVESDDVKVEFGPNGTQWFALIDTDSDALADYDGGRVGFAVTAGDVWIDAIEIKTDPNGGTTFSDYEVYEPWSDPNAAQALSHDAAGNLTFDGVQQLSYDGWNRLVEVERTYRKLADPNDFTAGDTVGTMTYDGAGRRIRKVIDNSADWDATYEYYYAPQWAAAGTDIAQVKSTVTIEITDKVRVHVWECSVVSHSVSESLNKRVNVQIANHSVVIHVSCYDVLHIDSFRRTICQTDSNCQVLCID